MFVSSPFETWPYNNVKCNQFQMTCMVFQNEIIIIIIIIIVVIAVVDIDINIIINIRNEITVETRSCNYL